MQRLLPEGTKHGNPYREVLSGTFVVDLRMFTDERGSIAELYRTEWFKQKTVQWNHTLNKAGVMRGAHVHLKRSEHVIIAQGESVFGMHDARPGSPTEGQALLLRLSGKKLQMLYIPTGVVHSIYSQTESIMLVGQTSYYERADEYDCYFNDPALKFTWPVTNPAQLIMTERDRTAGPLSALKKIVPVWRPEPLERDQLVPAPVPAVVR
ncbi:MAG: dTDP-4-dehydrorhamnose 3,5-epimerase family protein [Candidatus Andersenbacteria bacterium]